MARFLSSSSGPTITVQTEQGILEGSFDLLPIQAWFFEQSFGKANHWNQSFMIHVPGLLIETLRAIIKPLAFHHDMLRVRFLKSESGYQQYYQAMTELPELKCLNVSNFLEDVVKFLKEFFHTINILNYPEVLVKMLGIYIHYNLNE